MLLIFLEELSISKANGYEDIGLPVTLLATFKKCGEPVDPTNTVAIALLHLASGSQQHLVG